jgi:hypothetical protein
VLILVSGLLCYNVYFLCLFMGMLIGILGITTKARNTYLAGFFLFLLPTVLYHIHEFTIEPDDPTFRFDVMSAPSNVIILNI